MATDEFLLDRIRGTLKDKKVIWKEKRMFGGVCFMVDEKMCFGTFKGGLMVRINPLDVDALLKKPHSEQMMQQQRIMKGYLFIQPAGYDLDNELDFWIETCLIFNPMATSSKKRKK